MYAAKKDVAIPIMCAVVPTNVWRKIQIDKTGIPNGIIVLRRVYM